MNKWLLSRQTLNSMLRSEKSSIQLRPSVRDKMIWSKTRRLSSTTPSHELLTSVTTCKTWQTIFSVLQVLQLHILANLLHPRRKSMMTMMTRPTLITKVIRSYTSHMPMRSTSSLSTPPSAKTMVLPLMSSNQKRYQKQLKERRLRNQQMKIPIISLSRRSSESPESTSSLCLASVPTSPLSLNTSLVSLLRPITQAFKTIWVSVSA